MNGLDKAGSTPLHWAARGGHTGMHETLMTIVIIENYVNTDRAQKIENSTEKCCQNVF